ncbi:MAG TPA: dTDP-glucose 4,6-dehydratase [Saprospiraceae bacterium]|nr:dTDP-glucose 4,6-dehydratase [Saprospiraceae bacterium]HNT20377.1 dTDP-glucose 4,6-dehydratase [Saprospiraceae bacterium]
MKSDKTILITGGAGFIGSHAVRHFINKYPYRIVNLDALTYAGNLNNLKDIQGHPNYHFEKADIRDRDALDRIFNFYKPDWIMHFAAESHVDRSIMDPLAFIETNVLGTANLLLAARKHWQELQGKLFYHVSTDEVFGSLGAEGYFSEDTPYDPRSPYSASKASSDHFVRAYHHTYHIPVIVSNCSNNYGPYQFPEKLIPVVIQNILNEKPIPVYGDGTNIRDWLYVQDHIDAIDLIAHRGKTGETYLIGGHNELRNIDLVRLLCNIMDHKLGRTKGHSENLIRFVKDRPGHDQRYAIDASKLEKNLGWLPMIKPEIGLEMTVDWYLKEKEWLAGVTSGAYQAYYEQQYQNR